MAWYCCQYVRTGVVYLRPTQTLTDLEEVYYMSEEGADPSVAGCTAQHSPAQPGAAWRSPVQRTIAQHSAVQRSIAQPSISA